MSVNDITHVWNKGCYCLVVIFPFLLTLTIGKMVWCPSFYNKTLTVSRVGFNLGLGFDNETATLLDAKITRSMDA